MRMIRITAATAAFVMLTGTVPAWALGGGGTAPGGPLSGGIRPACNGYNMDGTVNRDGCDGRSVSERAAAWRQMRYR